MFAKLGDRLQRWMYGRYGYDEFSRFLSIVSFILILASLLFAPLLIPAWGLMLWSTFRGFSKKLDKRRRERDTYLRVMGKLKAPFRLMKNKHRDRKTHRYFKCKACKAVLRVPKGKGEIVITCPKCQNKIAKKT